MTFLFGSWQFWAILAAIFASLTAIFAKVGVSDIGSDFATFLRTLVVVTVLGILLWATGTHERLDTISAKSALFLVLSGLATGASWVCYFRALKIGQASQVAPVDKLSVVLVAIFGAIFLGEQISPMGWVGVSLVGAGAVLIAVA